MPNIVFIEADGTRTNADAETGDSVMRAAQNAGVDGIKADCGGTCTCATCHCFVDDEWIERVGAPNEFEDELLDLTESERQAGSRLSCQIDVTEELDGLVVRVPELQ